MTNLVQSKIICQEKKKDVQSQSPNRNTHLNYTFEFEISPLTKLSYWLTPVSHMKAATLGEFKLTIGK